jgi:hypothetical protein
MRYACKTLFTFSICILFVFLAKDSFAQPRGMTMSQVNHQTGRWAANQQMQFMRQMQMMNVRGAYSNMLEYDFQVTMLDGTKKEITSAIYTNTLSRKRFIIWVDKSFKKSDTNRYKKIYPSQTQDLSCVLIAENDGNPGSYLHGKITDSCWLFKTVSGPINGYSEVAVDANGTINQSGIIAIQLKDGPVLQLTAENLRSIVGQDADALAEIEKKNYYRAVKKYNRHTEKEAEK